MAQKAPAVPTSSIYYQIKPLRIIWCSCLMSLKKLWYDRQQSTRNYESTNSKIIIISDKIGVQWVK